MNDFKIEGSLCFWKCSDHAPSDGFDADDYFMQSDEDFYIDIPRSASKKDAIAHLISQLQQMRLAYE